MRIIDIFENIAFHSCNTKQRQDFERSLLGLPNICIRKHDLSWLQRSSDSNRLSFSLRLNTHLLVLARVLEQIAHRIKCFSVYYFWAIRRLYTSRYCAVRLCACSCATIVRLVHFGIHFLIRSSLLLSTRRGSCGRQQCLCLRLSTSGSNHIYRSLISRLGGISLV